MNIAQQSYDELYPEKTPKNCTLVYSGRLKAYNANIRMTIKDVTVTMSKSWKTISPEIQKGLIHELLTKIHKDKKHTINIDLYNTFIKNIGKATPKTQTHPLLENRFKQLNETHFAGIMDQPNLKIGKGINKLGTYEYATDTITISNTLLQHQELLDYVMYHEMLHKKHKYTTKHGRHTHHSLEFRKDEQKYPNAAQLEKELQKLVTSNKPRKKMFWFT